MYSRVAARVSFFHARASMRPNRADRYGLGSGLGSLYLGCGFRVLFNKDSNSELRLIHPTYPPPSRSAYSQRPERLGFRCDRRVAFAAYYTEDKSLIYSRASGGLSFLAYASQLATQRSFPPSCSFKKKER